MSRQTTVEMPGGGVRYVQVDHDPDSPKGPPPPRRITPTEQEPTHEYRAKRNQTVCRVCGALRANPIHF